MIVFDIWKPIDPPIIHLQDREILKLSKCTKYCLHKIVQLCKTRLEYNPKELSNSLVEYKIDLITSFRNTKYAVTPRQWGLTFVNPSLPSSNEDLPTEKYLGNLHYKLYAYEFPIITTIGDRKTVQNYIIESVYPRRLLNSPSILMNQMPSKIENELRDLTNEKLTPLVLFIEIQRNKKYMLTLKKNSILNFDIPHITPKNLIERNLRPDPKVWEIPTLENAELNLLKISKKLFQENFNDIEFFKIKCHKKAHEISKNKITLHSWKPDRADVKSLSWDPFKDFKMSYKEKCPTYENIKLKSFSINSPQKFHFPTIKSRYIDLIVDSSGYIGITQQQDLRRNKNMFSNNIAISAENTQNNSLDEGEKSKCNNIENNSKQHSKNDTSILPQKRTFLNNDLLSIIQLKKKQNIVIEDSSDYLQNTEFIKLLKEQSDPITSAHTLDDNKVITSGGENLLTITNFSKSTNESRQIIIANDEKLLENKDVINKIKSSSSVVIEELCLHSPCDFQLSANACAIKLDINKIFQSNGCGGFFYEKSLFQLLCQNQMIFLLIEYDRNNLHYDKDIFWKVRISFSHPLLRVVFIEGKSASISKWVVNISKNNKEDIEVSPTFTFLGINPFQELLLKLKLDNISLSELLFSLINKDESVRKVISPELFNILRRLIQEKWVVE